MRALLVLCACALYHLPMGVWATDEEDAEILSATDGDLHDLGAALESVLGRFAALLHGAKHRSSAASLFEAYNRFKDEADGVQTLGNQEVRELLKDLDVRPAVLRGNIATTVTRAVDSDGDKRISEPELSAAIAAVGCWVDGASETPLAPAKALAELAGRASKREGFEKLLGNLAACEPLRHLYRGLLPRNVGVEKAVAKRFGLDQPPLPQSSPTTLPCEEHLEHQLKQPNGRRDQTNSGVGASALRRELRALKVEPLLLRHLLAMGLILAFDTDANKKLSDDELQLAASFLCTAYAPVLGRKERQKEGQEASLVAILEGLIWPVEGWSIEAFLSRLQGEEGTEDVLRAVQNGPESPKELAEMVAAYVRLSPEGATRAHRDEL